MTINIEQILELFKAGTEFNLLPKPVLVELAQSLKIKKFISGTRIVSEGEFNFSMFVLISGRLRVSREDRDGKVLLYNEILPGECVGELGVILHQPRTADITAIRDSVLGILSQNSFETLLEKYPLEINKTFSQAIYNHLRHSRRLMEQKRAQSFVVIPLSKDVNVEKVSKNLAMALSKMGPARHVVLNSDSIRQTINIDQLEADNAFLIYQGDFFPSKRTRYGFEFADQILFVANAGASSEVSAVEKYLAREPGFKMKRSHMAVIHPAKSVFCEDKLKWQKDRNVERVCPAGLDELSDYNRIARFMVGKAVGVVLGGGGARGFAHLGALRAFEEADIPIDLLGGNSMGALIGACYAYGIPLEDIHCEILRFAKGAVRLNLPIVSILSGKNFEKALHSIFKDTQVQCLWMTYFAAACNLSRATTTVLDSGPLWKSVMASNSPAGLLSPVIYEGELMVDGAILENVPVQAMRSRLGTALERRRGNGTIIAIDVDVKEDITIEKNITHLNNWEVIKANFSSSRPKLPGVKDILTRSSLIGGLAQRGRIVFSADYYLEPPVSHFPLNLNDKTAVEIINLGYEYTIEQITKLNLAQKILMD